MGLQKACQLFLIEEFLSCIGCQHRIDFVVVCILTQPFPDGYRESKLSSVCIFLRQVLLCHMAEQALGLVRCHTELQRELKCFLSNLSVKERYTKL